MASFLDIDWLENPRGSLPAGTFPARLSEIADSERLAPQGCRRIPTLTLTFERLDHPPFRLRRTFTRSFRPGSALMRFLRQMNGKADNPFAAYSALWSNLGRIFLLTCTERERGNFLHIQAAKPLSISRAGLKAA